MPRGNSMNAGDATKRMLACMLFSSHQPLARSLSNPSGLRSYSWSFADPQSKAKQSKAKQSKAKQTKSQLACETHGKELPLKYDCLDNPDQSCCCLPCQKYQEVPGSQQRHVSTLQLSHLPHLSAQASRHSGMLAATCWQ